MRLLILDADPLIGTTLTDTVRRHLTHAHVDAALSLHAGIKQLAVIRYDAILTDARLHDAPGVAALSVLHQRYPDTPVILMAAQFGRDLMAYATLTGVYHFLHKPVEDNVLMATLNRVVEQQRLGLQIHQLTAKANRHTKRARKAITYARLLLEAKERLLSRRQEALAQSEENRRGLEHTLDRVPHGVLAFDRSWRLVWINESVPQHFRPHPRDEWLGKQVWEACPELKGSHFERECQRAVRNGTAVQFQTCFPRDEQWYDVAVMPHEDGLSVFIASAAAGPHPLSKISGDPGRASPPRSGTDVQIVDRTQEGFNHDAASRLAEHVQSARETERARIARDIQDDLGQLLTALKKDLAWLETRLPEEPLRVLLKVRFMTHSVGCMTDAVHRICTELRPAILDDLGFTGAMQWQASTFEHRTGVRCIVSIKSVARIDGERSTGLFRIFQTLLTHVARYTGATVVWVTLKEEAAWLILQVTDNGQGPAPNEADSDFPEISALKERAHLLGGELSIEGSAGQGMTVIVKIPPAA